MQQEAIKEEKLAKERRRELKERKRVKDRQREKEGDRGKEKEKEVFCRTGLRSFCVSRSTRCCKCDYSSRVKLLELASGF